MGLRTHAPDPPNACRRALLRARLAARLPPHSNGVGAQFQPLTVASNKSIIRPGVCGYCPSNARRLIIRCTDSPMFSHDPASGVYKGMIPWRNIHSTISGVLCPTRLSITRSIRNGGRFCGNVMRTTSPSCQRSHNVRFARRLSAGRVGSVVTIAASSFCSHPWSTTLVQRVTPWARRQPLCG